MQYITFSGVDGSGKSTQLELMREYLLGQGKRVAYFHAVEFGLANRLARLLRRKGPFQPGQEKAIIHTSLLSLLLRQKFLFLDLIRFKHFLTKLKHEQYDYLLSDRSFFDTVINLEYLALPHERALPFLLWHIRERLIHAMLPKPDFAFYFDLDPEVIMTRGRVPEQGLEYLRTKQRLFQKYRTAWQLLTIDATKSPDAIATTLLATLRSPK